MMSTMANPEDILNFLAAYRLEHGKAPTVREVAKAVDLAPSTVAGYYRRMERDGTISRVDRRRRGVEILDDEGKELRRLRVEVQQLDDDNIELRSENKRLKDSLGGALQESVEKVVAVFTSFPHYSGLSRIIESARSHDGWEPRPLNEMAKKVGLIEIKAGRMRLTEFGRMFAKVAF